MLNPNADYLLPCPWCGSKGAYFERSRVIDAVPAGIRDRAPVSRATLPKNTVLPARTTVQSVLWNQIKVEIDCVARKS